VRNPEKRRRIKEAAKTPLRDAAAANSTRIALGNSLQQLGLPVSFCTGGRTKFNRLKQGYEKDHWIDAICVGETGATVHIPEGFKPLLVRAEGRGSRQKCRVDRYGFLRPAAKAKKRVRGFATGDIVRAVVDTGKKKGVYVGRVAVRISGNFNITTKGSTVQGISYRFCKILQRSDGYSYSLSYSKTRSRSDSDASASVLAEGLLHSSSP